MSRIVNKFQNPPSPLQNYKDSYIGKLYNKDKPLSPVDPIGEFVVSGAILGKPLQLAGKTLLPIFKNIKNSNLLGKFYSKQKILKRATDRFNSFEQRLKNKGLKQQFDNTEITDNVADAIKKKTGYQYNPNNSLDNAYANYLNSNPAVTDNVFGTNKRFIFYNDKVARQMNIPKEDVLSHEFQHVLNNKTTSPSSDVFDYIKSGHKNYFLNENSTDLAARGVQLKNYFGFKGNEQLTENQLKYAAKHYVDDVGFDNNMTDMFNGIVDWKKMAKWLSDNSVSLTLPVIYNKTNTNGNK